MLWVIGSSMNTVLERGFSDFKTFLSCSFTQYLLCLLICALKELLVYWSIMAEKSSILSVNRWETKPQVLIQFKTIRY